MYASTISSNFLSEITVRTKGRACGLKLRRFVNHRLASSLGRFERRIRQAIVWLEDVNGPRGGIDKQCRIEVHLIPRGHMSVEAHAANEYSAISIAANRARNLLDRRYKRA